MSIFFLFHHLVSNNNEISINQGKRHMVFFEKTNFIQQQTQHFRIERLLDMALNNRWFPFYNNSMHIKNRFCSNHCFAHMSCLNFCLLCVSIFQQKLPVSHTQLCFPCYCKSAKTKRVAAPDKQDGSSIKMRNLKKLQYLKLQSYYYCTFVNYIQFQYQMISKWMKVTPAVKLRN